MRSLTPLLLLALFAPVPASGQASGWCFDECTAASGCNVLLCTTLDNMPETLVPDVGPIAKALGSFDFVPGAVGSGLLADKVGEYVAYPQIGRDPLRGPAQSIENSQGTLDFWYQPFYDKNDPAEYFIFTNVRRRPIPGGTVITKPSSLEILKHSSLGNGNSLAIIYWDGVATETLSSGVVIPKRWEFWVRPADYQLTSGVFTHLRLTWDWSSSGVPVRFWQDGRELPLERADGGPAWTGPMGVADESLNEAVYICGRPAGAGGPLFQFNGVCDEVRIYDQPVAPNAASASSNATANASACGLGPELAAILPLLAWARSRRKRASA